VRRGADHPRGAIGVGRAALGQAPDRFQKQHVLFRKHGISSSAMVPPLVWRDAGKSRPCHVAGCRFQDVFEETQKWLRPPREMFRWGCLHETEITESLIAISQRRHSRARPFPQSQQRRKSGFRRWSSAKQAFPNAIDTAI
jgi:hypothetical protein